MVLFNHATREMTAKIVYYGPGLCGKTTNLLVIYDKLDPSTKGKMLSLATRSDRTLFFDLLPVELGKVGTFNLKMQLYTVPGQVFYNETRKLVLRGADSVVFVVDSQPSMLESNRESFENLLDNLRENRIDPDDLPIVIQYNKRDIAGVLPVREIQKHIGLDRYASIEASAIKGDGVMETFKLVSKLTAKKLLTRMKGKEILPEVEAALSPMPMPMPEGVDGSSGAAASAEDAAPALEPADRFSVANIAAANAGPTLSRGDVTPPFEEHYEKMEEISLEQLLEGRDRPLTMRHDQPPLSPDAEEVEDLSEADLVTYPATAESTPFLLMAQHAEESPAGEHSPASPVDPEGYGELATLRAQMLELQQKQKQILATLSRVVDELSTLIR